MIRENMLFGSIEILWWTPVYVLFRLHALTDMTIFFVGGVVAFVRRRFGSAPQLLFGRLPDGTSQPSNLTSQASLDFGPRLFQH